MSELLNRVNWLDVFALIVLIRVSYVSSQIGVGKQILPCVLLIVILSAALYNYSELASFFIQRTHLSLSVSRFLSYFLIMSTFFVIYRILSRVAGFCLFSGENKAGFIETVGGALLGVLRSILIMGIIITGLGLAPIRFVERAIKGSYSGVFFLDTNLKIYNSVMDFILKRGPAAYRMKAKEFLSEKESYLFEGFLDIKKKPRIRSIKMN